jgi:hypothetical protein
MAQAKTSPRRGFEPSSQRLRRGWRYFWVAM